MGVMLVFLLSYRKEYDEELVVKQRYSLEKKD